MSVRNNANRSMFALALLAAASSAGAAGVQCAMSHAFDQIDVDAPKGFTSVWKDEAGNLMFIAPLQVNTDGTRKSYSIADFRGESVALNHLCNAMRDGCQGLGKQGIDKRRDATMAAAKAGWPADKLAQTKLAPNIIPMPNGKPCPEVNGFLVSSTALQKRRITNVCDQSNYVDAAIIPALVIPRDPDGKQSDFSVSGVRVGDLAIAVGVESARFIPSVVGDAGPVDKIGEGSIALNMRLAGATVLPTNYKQAKALAAPKTLILIFKGSRNTADPYMSLERIDRDGIGKFESWGGLPRAQACVSAYQNHS